MRRSPHSIAAAGPAAIVTQRSRRSVAPGFTSTTAANDPGPVRDAVVGLGVGATAVPTADEPRTPGPVARRCKRLRLQADAITEPEPAHRDHLLLVTERAGPGGVRSLARQITAVVVVRPPFDPTASVVRLDRDH